MQQPLVSVIVPVYGVEKYIERCARSIFEQTYENIEIIFVNDCTPDKSMEVLAKVMQDYLNIQSKVRVINHEVNRGVAITRRDGMITAKGKYVIQWDSDDYVDVQFLEKMVALAEKEDADITICDMNNVYKDKTVRTYVNPSLDNIECMKQILVGKVHGGLWNKLIRRSLYVDNNIYPVEGLNMREDLSVMYRLMFFANKLAYLPEALYNYILEREGSYTSTRNEKYHKNSLDIIKCIDFFAKENNWGEDLLDTFNKFKMLIYYDLAYYGDSVYLRKNKDIFKGISSKSIMKNQSIKLVIFYYFALWHYYGFENFVNLIKWLRRIKF